MHFSSSIVVEDYGDEPSQCSLTEVAFCPMSEYALLRYPGLPQNLCVNIPNPFKSPFPAVEAIQSHC